jgi:hypothetical protein
MEPKSYIVAKHSMMLAYYQRDIYLWLLYHLCDEQYCIELDIVLGV